MLIIAIVFDNRRGRDVGTENFEASYGGEARFEERATGERHQGEGIQNLYR